MRNNSVDLDGKAFKFSGTEGISKSQVGSSADSWKIARSEIEGLKASEPNNDNLDDQAKLRKNTRELAAISQFLMAAENNGQWMRNVLKLIISRPSWWRFMPLRWQSHKLSLLLKREGLFDTGSYLQRYPDVAKSGMDPFDHYILHGQNEGRIR